MVEINKFKFGHWGLRYRVELDFEKHDWTLASTAILISEC